MFYRVRGNWKKLLRTATHYRRWFVLLIVVLVSVSPSQIPGLQYKKGFKSDSDSHTIIALWPYYWAGRPSRTVRQETCPLFELLTVSPNPGQMRPSVVNWGSVAATHIYPTWEYAPSIVHGTAPTSTSGNSFCTFLSPTSEAKMQSSLILLAGHGNIVGSVRHRESDAYLGYPSPWSCAKRLLRFRQWRLRGPV